jgi:beta-galactosidase
MFLSDYRKFCFVSTLLFLFFIFHSTICAQSSDPLAELSLHGLKYQQITPTRGRILLDGEWQASTNNGKSWRPIVVPSVFEHDRKVIFERHVFVPADFINRFVFGLVVGNGGASTEVRVNDEYVAIHTGAYSRIDVKIPDRLLQAGSENIIKIICDDRLNPVSTIPLRQLAFQPKDFSGLFRSTFLELVPPIYFDKPTVRITVNPNYTSANLECSAVVYASDYSRFGIDSSATSLPLTVHAELVDKASGKIVAKSADDKFELAQNHNMTVTLMMQVQNPALWSPSDPKLYELDLYLYNGTTLIDEYSENIGFRIFGVSGGKFYLNGSPIFVKSVNYVLDYPERGATDEDVFIEKDIAVIKTLGANAIRVMNYPPPRELLDLCDRFGLMVFEEIPLMDAPPAVLESNQYRGALQGYLRDVVHLTSYHPSAVAVSIGSNLDPTSNVTKEYISSAANLVHSESDLLVYYTPLTGIADGTESDADFVGLDLTLFNSAGKIKKFLSFLSTMYPKTTFWVSSVGTQTQLDNHEGYSDPLSLEHQARYIVDAYGAVEDENIGGVSINSFADWEGAVPHLMPNGHPYLYTFGLVSYWRERRPSFAAVRALFNDETLPTLPIGNYTDAPPIIYVILSTLLLVLVTYLHYSRRWFRESATRAVLRPYNFFADVRDQRMISAFQTFSVLLLISAGIAIYLSSLFYAFRDNYVLDRMLGLLLPNGALKIRLDYLIWHPIQFILVFTILFMVMSLFITLIIKFVSYLVKIRLQMVSAFTVATWSALPMAVLILADMILFRLLDDPRFVWASCIVLALLFLWSLVRLFHGISVIFDLATVRVGIIGSVVLIALFLLITIYYNGTNGIIPYTKFFYKFLIENRLI